MEQKRKIIIETGANGNENLTAPHFDAEATLTARPVVPLSASPAEPPAGAGRAPRVINVPLDGGARSGGVQTATSWKRTSLIVVVLAAIGLGVASGFAIGVYQSRQKASNPGAPVVKAPAQTIAPEVATAPATQPEPVAAQPATAPQPESSREEAPASETEASALDEEATPEAADKSEARKERAAREERRRDEEETPVITPTIIRPKPRVEPADDGGDAATPDRAAKREERKEERKQERQRRREERRQPPADEGGDYSVYVPREAERVRRNVDRIRDIFEGRQP